MASKSISGIILTALSVSILFTAAPTRPAQALAPSDLPLLQHTIRFYVDPALLGNMDFARSVLPKYVADMNSILAKNTRRRLVFDPQTGIIPTTTKPQTDTGAPPLPTENFEVWAHVTATTYPISYGGYAGGDISGAGVLAGLYWTRLYDPEALAAANVRDYTTQIDHMVHELAHVFGAGLGEYYNLGTITDTTGMAPLLNINVNSAADPYWSDKPDFAADPLLRFTAASSRSDYLSKVLYSNLTAAVLNGSYRNGVPTFDHFTVQVVDRTGHPVPAAEVKVWNVETGSPFQYISTLLYDEQTDEAGQVTLAWGGVGGPHNAGNLLRLIKVYQDGVPLTAARYVSAFDLDIAQLVKGQSSFTVTMPQANQPPSDITLSNTGIDENQPAGTLIGELTAADPDGGESLTFSFCGGPDDASFQIDGSDLLSATSFDYETRSSYSMCVQADDGRGGLFDKTMTVSVNNLPDPNMASFTSLPGNDGWVLESRQGSNRGGSINAGSARIFLGEDARGRRYRSVLAFNTGSLPDDAIITKVTLKVRKQGVTATDPFATLGDLILEMGSPIIGPNAKLQASDFQAPAAPTAAGTFASQPDADGWYSAELQPPALSLMNLSGPTQFRLGFTGTGNSGADYVTLYSGNAPANRPQLIVEYYLP